MTLRKSLAGIVLSLGALASVLLAPAALADRVVLKDGTVIEGKISREGDGFVYVEQLVGGVKTSRLVLRSDIKTIEKDGEGVTKPAPVDTPVLPKGPADAPAAPKQVEQPVAAPDVSDGATKVAFISLEEMVGTYMNAKAFKRSVELLKSADPDVVVLRINSGGGYLAEIQDLVDVIQDELKPRYHTVAWIESAISAASMTAIACEEIYFMREGNFGGSVGFSTSGGKAKRVDGEDLEQVLRMMEKVSRSGGHDPLIMRAMQVPTDLSVDVDPATGVAKWRNDLNGQYIVSTLKGDRILTLNALDAVKYKFARAIADTKDDLARAMNLGEWVEVAPEADAHQVQYRKDVKAAEVKIGELDQKVNMALQVGQTGRALAYLGEMKTWVRRAVAFEKYMGLTDEWFRQREEQIRKIAADLAEREKQKQQPRR